MSCETLDSYLVSGVEDPRVNVQSILNRSLLCDLLMPGRFTQLLEDELRFGFVMTWLITLLQRGIDRDSLRSALCAGDRDKCPDFVLETLPLLQTPSCSCSDYISAAFGGHDPTDRAALSLANRGQQLRIEASVAIRLAANPGCIIVTARS